MAEVCLVVVVSGQMFSAAFACYFGGRRSGRYRQCWKKLSERANVRKHGMRSTRKSKAMIDSDTYSASWSYGCGVRTPPRLVDTQTAPTDSCVM